MPKTMDNSAIDTEDKMSTVIKEACGKLAGVLCQCGHML